MIDGGWRKAKGWTIGACGISFLIPAFAAGAETPPQLLSEEQLFSMPLEQLITISTGTRQPGTKAADSATPVVVLSSDSLASTGQTSLFDALKSLLPSFSAVGMNFDTGALVRSFRLRGLNSGEVLVLINGKRRHSSANMNLDGGPDQGSTPVDLDLIPLSLVDHVEILKDGAAAQYGSDAVAGVINIILKSHDHGGAANLQAGITSRGDGSQALAGTEIGHGLGNGGFLDLSADYRYHDFTNRTGYNALLDYSVRGKIIGDPLSDTGNLGFNLQVPTTGQAVLYGFGTLGLRYAAGNQNQRSGSVAPSIYPGGFIPVETMNELDGALTAGVKGDDFWGWGWDLSTSWGRDSSRIGVADTANVSLLAATGASPTSVQAGGQYDSQLTTNLDLHRAFDAGLWAAPLNAAFGLEHRLENYGLTAGEPASYILGGTEGYSGFEPQDASDSWRNVEAVYLDLSSRPIRPLLVDLAGRFENYQGTGSTETGKISLRYDVSPRLAFRMSANNGFHAPTLAQSHFSQTASLAQNSGGGQIYYVNLPVDSPGGKVLGAPPLQPETSKDFNIGIVGEPLPGTHASLDAYQIDLNHRIIDSQSFTGPLPLAAVAAQGDPIPAGSEAFVNYFTNGVSTRTRGADLSLNRRSDLGRHGAIDWQADGNLNVTAITRYAGPPAFASLPGMVYMPTPEMLTNLTRADPQNRIQLQARYMLDDFDALVRVTRYGHSHEIPGSDALDPNYVQTIGPAYITDASVGWRFSPGLKLTLGGNNIFDQMPAHPSILFLNGRKTEIWPVNTPWGIDGALFYARLTATF